MARQKNYLGPEQLVPQRLIAGKHELLDCC